MAADEWVVVLQRFRQRRNRTAVTGVSERDASVAQQPGPSSTPDSALAKPQPERVLVKPQEVLEQRSRLDDRPKRGERRRIRFRPMPVGVDRTDLLTQVAAEHPVADQRTDLGGNHAAVLD